MFVFCHVNKHSILMFKTSMIISIINIVEQELMFVDVNIFKLTIFFTSNVAY